MLRSLALISFVLLSCGGDPTVAGACNVTCDCPKLNAPVKCVGEWACNAQSRCQYSCKNTCDSSGVSTCGADDDCNGSFCSARKACP